MTNLNSQDLAKYSAAQVASLVDVDVYAVRSEGDRRQSAAEKKIALLTKQLAKAQADLAASGIILQAVFSEMAR